MPVICNGSKVLTDTYLEQPDSDQIKLSCRLDVDEEFERFAPSGSLSQWQILEFS